MEVERDAPGHWHFALGPVEKWIVGIVGGLVVAVAVMAWSSITTRLDKQNDGLGQVKVQQAVIAAQLAGLNAQLADIPSLRARVSENTVVIKRNTEDIAELRRVREAE